MNLPNPEEGIDEALQGSYDKGSQEAIGMVVAVCMALLVVLATDDTVVDLSFDASFVLVMPRLWP